MQRKVIRKRGRPPKSETELQVAEGAELVPQTKSKKGRENFGCELAQPGDNAKYLRFALMTLDLPPINISDPEQVKNRILEYFYSCIDKDMKPNVLGMANWLGVSRKTIERWKNGDCREREHQRVMEWAYGILEGQWMEFMMNGKVNPASGIFIGKNHFGYRDTIDIAPTKAPPLGEMEDRKALEARILDADVEDE